MEITAQKREILGKGLRALREQGLIPAELYGNGVKNQHLTVSEKEFAKAYKEAGESTVVTLVVGKEKFPTMIKDVLTDSLSDKLTHVDFYAVKMDEKIEAMVALNFIGESIAVKSGGVLVKALREIEVEAFPQDLPHDIEVDLSKLEEINQSIHVSDLKVSDKVKILTDLEAVVASVTEVTVEEEVAPAVSVEDVKVEGEEKKKEAEAKKEEEK